MVGDQHATPVIFYFCAGKYQKIPVVVTKCIERLIGWMDGLANTVQLPRKSGQLTECDRDNVCFSPCSRTPAGRFSRVLISRAILG